MNRRVGTGIGLVVVVLALAAVAVGVKHFRAKASESNVTVVDDRSVSPTSADGRIKAAQRAITASPHRSDGFNLLASAYMQKARETNDFSFNSRAEAALNRSLELTSDDYDALKLRTKLLLTFHRFKEALELGQKLKLSRPDDHDIYGMLTDAYVELGNYTEAINAAQRMVDLRPDSNSYARVSYLRSLHGDTEGAIQAMEV